MTRERVSLYFNTDIPIEKAMWDFICKDGKKSYTIKKIIEQAMTQGNNYNYIEQAMTQEDTGSKNIIQSDEDEVIDDLGEDPCM